MTAELFSATILLVLVIDPFGNVPLVVAALRNVAPERHARIVLRECAAAYVILLGVHVRRPDVPALAPPVRGVADDRRRDHPVPDRDPDGLPAPRGVFGDMPGAEPFLVPLAIPSIAGPSALATVMLMASRDPAKIGSWAIALTVAMGATTVVLVLADRLQRWLGERVVLAFERLMGLVLTALAVEMLLSGVRSFVGSLAR